MLVQPTLDVMFCMAVTQIEADEIEEAKLTIQQISDWIMGNNFANRYNDQEELHIARAKILASLASLRVRFEGENAEETFEKAIEETDVVGNYSKEKQAKTLSIIVRCMAQVELYDKALALTKSIFDENFDSIEDAFSYITRAMYDFGYKSLAKKTLKESLNYMYEIAEKFPQNHDIQQTVTKWKSGNTIGLAGIIDQAKYMQEIQISSERIKALADKIIPEEKTETEEVQYSANLLKYNLKHFFTKHPGQKFYLGVDTGIKGAPGTDLTPNYKVLRKLSEIFPDLVLIEGEGQELADKIIKETNGKYNNVGIVSKLANLNIFGVLQSRDIGSGDQVKPCITTIDDSGKEFEYLPILEAASISIMMAFQATDQSILSFYNKISRDQITLKELQAMLTKKIINILPKIKYGDHGEALRARNEMVKRIYLSV